MTMPGYQLRKITEPVLEPITREQAKQQCRVDADITEDDAWFDDAIAEAREHIESYLQSTLIETEWELQTADFPWCADSYYLPLPMGPVINVAAFTYLDRDGNRTTLDADSAYTLVKHGTAGHLIPGYQVTWPAARGPFPGNLVIRYTAGYQSAGSPAGADGVPRAIKRACKLLVAHWYENREAIVAGTITKEMELGFYDTLQPFRNYP